MKNARSIIAGTLAAATAVVAQNATITGAPSTMKTATPSSNSNIITTSILWAAGNVDDIINALPDPTALPTDDLSLKGSIVTVVPDGTVVSIACPYTTEANKQQSLFCDIVEGYTYTLKPGHQNLHATYELDVRGVHAVATQDSACTATGKDDIICAESLSMDVSGYGEKTSTTTAYTSTYSNAVYTALYITGGLDKAAAIPEATNKPGAAANVKGNVLLGAAGALAAAALAL